MSKAEFTHKKEIELEFYKLTLDNLKILNQKINIINNSITNYTSLIEEYSKDVDLGIKIKTDLETLINSKKIQILQKDLILLEIQNKILSLYSKTTLLKFKGN